MLYAMFKDHKTSGSGGEDFEGFFTIYECGDLLCDPDAANTHPRGYTKWL